MLNKKGNFVVKKRNFDKLSMDAKQFMLQVSYILEANEPVDRRIDLEVKASDSDKYVSGASGLDYMNDINVKTL